MKRLWIEIILVAFILACGGGSTILYGAHYMTLNWTAPQSMPSGSYLNLYRGTASGGESATPLAKIAATTITFQDDNVSANGTYYYTIKQCVVPTGGSEVCSASPPEAHATIPLVGADVSSPGAFVAVPH
jgi:hypothetical protein